MKEPTKKRKKIIQQVYDGVLDVDMITDDELKWLESYVKGLMFKKMAENTLL